MNRESKKCQNCHDEFWIEPDDFVFYKKMDVPPPTFCPECRLVRRMSVRNERSLYKDICDLCGKQFISMYSPNENFKVYCRECWYSDKWDALSYSKKYDFSKPFFEQFRQLTESVPHIGIVYIHENFNCDYANYVADSKNVYLSQSIIAKSEDVYYSKNIDSSKEIFDCLALKDSEKCYWNLDGSKNYQCRFILKSRECINSDFLFDCVNCQNCFLGSNLRNKRFVIRNKQYSKENYFAEVSKINFGQKSEIDKLNLEFLNLVEKSLHKFGNLTKTINCTGDNLENCKNVLWSFDTYNAENLKFCSRSPRMQDSYDLYGGADGELLYEAIYSGYRSYNSQFFYFGEVTINSQYVNECLGNSSHLFACVGLRNKQYCILNKQYTKEEYEELVPKIIEHMNEMPYVDKQGRVYKYGEFFPPELSPFTYNETIAQEYFPLTKEQVIEQGYQWKDPETRNYQIDIMSENLPDNIKDVDDSIIGKVIECAHNGECNEQCTEAFKIIKEELQFYKKMNLPLPRLCPNCRHYGRLKQRNPLKLWNRKCQCSGGKSDNGVYQNTAKHKDHPEDQPCPNEFETSYIPERPEIVYCEACYQAEVV